MESVEVPQPCGCQQDFRFHEVNTAQVFQGVVVWTLLEGTQFAEDPRGQKVSRRRSGAMEAQGGGVGVFHFREKLKVVLRLSLLLVL